MTGYERLPNRREFKKWKPSLKECLHEVENYRIYDGENRPRGNVAVVVLKDGRAFVGRSVCSEQDQYSAKRGYAVAMGRALRAAARGRVTSNSADFVVHPLVGGVELRDVCRERVGLEPMKRREV